VQGRHLSVAELEAGLDDIHSSPKDGGLLEMIVRRPTSGSREVVDEATLDGLDGLVGDNWRTRGNPRRPDGTAHPETQVTVMSARAAALVAQDRARWPLAGDQLYIDLDLSLANLPAGTRLAIGSAVLEVTAEPHTGCAKFVARFGVDAMKFVNSAVGRQLNLRGINTRVLVPGVIRVGDIATKVGRSTDVDTTP
jgi:MOSC domain-containing protein YiiM